MQIPPNKAMQRMSGTHVGFRFGCFQMPLIGDLGRWAAGKIL
jgi:hypothetical protein